MWKIGFFFWKRDFIEKMLANEDGKNYRFNFFGFRIGHIRIGILNSGRKIDA